MAVPLVMTATKLPLVGVVVGLALVLGDRQHRHRDAGRIGQRQVALGRHRLGGDDFELAGPALAVKQQRFLVGEGRPRARPSIFSPFQLLGDARPPDERGGTQTSGLCGVHSSEGDASTRLPHCGASMRLRSARRYSGRPQR